MIEKFLTLGVNLEQKDKTNNSILSSIIQNISLLKKSRIQLTLKDKSVIQNLNCSKINTEKSEMSDWIKSK